MITDRRIKYLVNLLPMSEDKLKNKYWEGFEKYATYTGSGTYQWQGLISSDIRELWLMGVLWKESIEFKQE
jgi:hypothetical protein